MPSYKKTGIITSLLIHVGLFFYYPNENRQEHVPINGLHLQTVQISLLPPPPTLHPNKTNVVSARIAHPSTTQISSSSVSKDKPAIKNQLVNEQLPAASFVSTPIWQTGHGWGRRAGNPNSQQGLMKQMVANEARVAYIQDTVSRVLNDLNQHQLNHKDVWCLLKLPITCSPRIQEVENRIATRIGMLPIQYPEIALIRIGIVDDKWIQSSIPPP